MPLSAGTRLGPYEIVSLLGRGGMGEVYRARDPRLAREVAIKVLHAAVTLDPDRRHRFELEARAAGGLSHPNIVAVFDIGSEDGAMYVVQELLEGETLRDRLQSGALPLRKALDYAVQTARGLAAAHAKGIVHRDLKPENLFLTKDGRLKILDFGLAKLTSARAAPPDVTSAPTEVMGTEPGVVLGTIGYMSPEQVRGQAVDHRSDLFSLGAILFEMVAGRRAFQGLSPADTMSAILKEEPADLSSINPSLSAGLDRLIRHALEKNPDERFHSAQDFAFDLDSLSGATSASHVAPPVTAPMRRKPLLAAALAIGALAAGIFLGRTFFTRSATDLAAYRFTALASEQGVKDFAAWSPDDKTIAYSVQIDGVFQIVTRSLDQAVPAQLTHSKSDCLGPFWSPDNTRIYYISSWNLWEIGAAGGTPEKRASDVRGAHISPDGKTLVLARRDPGGTSLWVQPATGSEARKFAIVKATELPYPRFSPDGASIGIWTGDSTYIFWQVSYPGAEVRKAVEASSTTRGVSFMSFAWFPDSRHIAFSGAQVRTGNYHLLVADVRSGTVGPLTPAMNAEATPSVSSDGRRIAFTLRNDDADIIQVPLDSTPVSNVLATSAGEHCAAWSPKGDQFAYAKEHNGTDEIWVYSVREGLERPLVTAASFRDSRTDRVSEPRYSPDGQRIAFARISDGKYGLWLVNVLGGTPVPLGVAGAVPSWSPDGNWISYQNMESGRWGLGKTAAGGGGSPVQLMPVGAGMWVRSQWSPRGDWITWLSKDGLAVVSPDGSRSEVLSTEPGWQQAGGFSKDGAEVICIRKNENHHLVVEAIEISGKRRRAILDMGPQAGVHGFSLAPDGKSFLTTLQRNHDDIWLLEGFPKP